MRRRPCSLCGLFTLMCAGPFPWRPLVGRGTASPSWMTSHATLLSTSCTQRTKSSLPTCSGRPSWNVKRASWSSWPTVQRPQRPKDARKESLALSAPEAIQGPKAYLTEASGNSRLYSINFCDRCFLRVEVLDSRL